jgi:acyl-ACP thioesterase
MYSFQSRVRYSELNHQKEILDSSAIINYFQDCSTFQSEDLNHGLTYLQTNNRLWMLSSWHLNILRPAQLGDNIIIGTWAYDFKNFYGYRNFIMKNDNEEVMAAADSIWVYIDTNTGRPTKIPEDYPVTSGYGMEPPYPMEHTERKIALPDTYTVYPSFAIIKSNIDSYNHVNNGQYIKLAEEYLPDHFMVKSMRAEYRMQALLGNTIVPLIAAKDDCYTIILANEAHKPYAVVEFCKES